MTTHSPVLVTGATGRQGGATARALLRAGVPVRALVRDPASDQARALRDVGAVLFSGDLRDPQSLVQACQGMAGVFSVQTPLDGVMDYESERRQGRNLVEAALAAGVTQFVHTSVSGAGEYARSAPGWDEGRWTVTEYWTSKEATENLVAEAGYERWTILRPTTFMDHPTFRRDSVADGLLVTTISPNTVISLIAPHDIGIAAAAAFADPDRFHRVRLELGGDLRTIGQITATLSEVWADPVVSTSITPDEARAAGVPEHVIEFQEWLNVVGSPATPAQAHELGLSPIDFRTWADDEYRT